MLAIHRYMLARYSNHKYMMPTIVPNISIVCIAMFFENKPLLKSPKQR